MAFDESSSGGIHMKLKLRGEAGIHDFVFRITSGYSCNVVE